MPNDGSLDALPMSPCTSGSLGLDHHFLGTVPLKLVENHSTSSLKGNHATQVEDKAVVVDDHHEEEEEEEKEKEEELHTEHTEHKREHEHDHAEHERENEHGHAEHEREHGHDHAEHEREHEREHGHDHTEHEREYEHDRAEHDHEHEHDHAEHEEERQEEMNGEEHEAEPVEETTHVETELVKEVTHEAHNVVEDLTEKTHELTVTTVTPPAAALLLVEEKKVSEIPERPVTPSMPTYAATRGLSAASLALKKKQAAQNALASTKAMAVEVPETDSILNRIKMFGGSHQTRIGTPGGRKTGVRDMVQKYKNVEDLSQEEIAHVARGHDASGVYNAYSLSTASRPVNALRSTPRRKMSHEMGEHETRSTIKATVSGHSHASEEDEIGVSQESVQSVRNAKSLFENLARSERAHQ